MARPLQPDDEFYVGYAPRPPQRTARLVWRAVVGLEAAGILVALALIFGQQRFAKATFEFQQYRDFAGVVETRPYPALLVPQPGGTGRSRYLLVAEGKHGADAAVADFSGQAVTLRGSLIYRDGQTMIELMPGTLKARGTAAGAGRDTELGPVAVTGEIVDSKCYLGVMNPGRTKVHRDCAVRCISGGIPPLLVTSEGLYLLVGADGRQLNREVRDYVGETIEVEGMAVRSGESLILKAEPAKFRRVPR